MLERSGQICDFIKGTHYYQTVDEVQIKMAELLKGLTESYWQRCFQECLQQFVDAEGNYIEDDKH